MKGRKKHRLAQELWGLMPENIPKNLGFILANDLTSSEIDDLGAEILRRCPDQLIAGTDISLSRLEERIQWLREEAGFVQAVKVLTETNQIGNIRIYEVSKVVVERITDPTTPFANHYESGRENIYANHAHIFLESEFIKTFYRDGRFQSGIVGTLGKGTVIDKFKEAVYNFIFSALSDCAGDSGYARLFDVSNLKQKLETTEETEGVRKTHRLLHHPNTADLISSELLSWWVDADSFLGEWKTR